MRGCGGLLLLLLPLHHLPLIMLLLLLLHSPRMHACPHAAISRGRMHALLAAPWHGGNGRCMLTSCGPEPHQARTPSSGRTCGGSNRGGMHWWARAWEHAGRRGRTGGEGCLLTRQDAGRGGAGGLQTTRNGTVVAQAPAPRTHAHRHTAHPRTPGPLPHVLLPSSTHTPTHTSSRLAPIPPPSRATQHTHPSLAKMSGMSGSVASATTNVWRRPASTLVSCDAADGTCVRRGGGEGVRPYACVQAPLGLCVCV